MEEDKKAGDSIIQCSETQENSACYERVCFESEGSKVLKNLHKTIFSLSDIFIHKKTRSFSKKYFLSCIASVGFGLNIDCFNQQESTFEKNAKCEDYCCKYHL